MSVITLLMKTTTTKTAAKAHAARVAALKAEIAECHARCTPAGDLMAENVRKDLALIEARWAA